MVTETETERLDLSYLSKALICGDMVYVTLEMKRVEKEVVLLVQTLIPFTS